jgi:hydrogenase maturation protease
MIKPILVFGYGNLSRGDDALGPLLLDYIESHCDLTKIDLLTDFQLQIEHALDLEHRSLVLFVDASVACINTFDFLPLSATRDKSYTTHVMSPAAVLAVYVSIKKQPPPPSFLISIKAESMELGEGLSMAAENNLQQACLFVKQLLKQSNLEYWLQQTEKAVP